MRPYYEDESVTLYHGRCEDVLPLLDPGTVDVLLTDPPYFNVKDEDWDRQWAKADQFLGWLGDVLDSTLPLLADASSVWMFASPALTSRVEREVIAPRLRLLNSIRWVKEAGWHQKAEIEAQRRYLTAWEGLLLAERDNRRYVEAVDALRKEVLAPVALYIKTERLRAGVGRLAIAQRLVAAGLYRNEDTGTSMCSDWEHGDSLPTEAGYGVLREALGDGYLARDWADLRREWDALTSEYYTIRDRELTRMRRHFAISRSGPVTDVWNFPPVMGYPGKHPCEKPLSMLAHMIEVSSRPGDLILDPFAGSGSTLRAAKDAGRRAIGIEMDERWCAKTARRLSQEVFDFGGAA